jgi:isoleucyl-tRNA synthetase
MYQKVTTDMNFVGREKEIAKFWKDNDIIKKSFTLRDGCPPYTFYDGPPTANGLPHIGHVLTRVMKDLLPRYHTMKGKSVLRIAGWDTHGLPVELEVEKRLGINGKPEIEKFGIEPFIHECKKSVWNYLSEWEDMSERVGFWLDMEHPYVTYHDNYIESVWWSLKQIADKGLLYQGHKVVPFCPRCGTALSSHEVAQGYKEVEEYSAYVHFKVKDKDNAYLLAWTTTPWTLPSNVALCVNPDEDYLWFDWNGQTCVMAKALVSQVTGEDFESIKPIETVKGKDLEGLEYEPMFTVVSKPREKGWYVVSDHYVTLSDGTGIVHIAPAFGEDDARLGRENNLPFVQLVNTEGNFVEGSDYAGMYIKDADAVILKDLEERGLLLKKALYAHNYPHCWRCDTPLVYYARGGWFIRMTALRDELVKYNQGIDWRPPNIREGRMGNFVGNVTDWALSRERYWGTPLPVWICDDCDHQHVIGSKQEAIDMADGPCDLPELHRPWIDRVVLRCPKCQGKMHRVSEVIDCWYDSGAMPFAQWHYPFENKEKFESRFPADFISEAVDQTRGWFYSLLAIGTAVFDQSPYKQCLVLGHVQDKDGRKMSKHLGNVVDPWDILNNQGADAARWYFYTAGAPWLPSRFYPEAVVEGQRKYMSTLWNTYAFYILYADIDKFNPMDYPLDKAALTLMDRWILSRLNTTVKLVDAYIADIRFPEAAAALQSMVDDLSNWYVRRGRERFWGKGMTEDKAAAFTTLAHVLKTMSLLTAPMTPFMAEAIYQNLVRTVDKNAPESVHLCDFPVVEEKYLDADVEKQMAALVEVVQLGRACRNLANLKVRQPLSRMLVSGAQFDEEYAALAKDELNVKAVEFVSDASALSSYKLKPQLRTLGPKYGKLLGKISKALSEADGDSAVAGFDKGEDLVLMVDGQEVRLSKDDVLIETIQKEGLVAQSDRGVTVALDTQLTEELINEGYARELISRLQNMRKDAGFDVTDRICVTCQAEEALQKALAPWVESVKGVALAEDFAFDQCKQGEGFTQELDINGLAATVSIHKV